MHSIRTSESISDSRQYEREDMVYDCFQFFNELEMLKIRMNIMDPVVDRFVISEATVTFSGEPKPLYYEEHKDEFAAFADKIIHVVVRDTPQGYTHDCDTFQKNAVGRGLEGCTDDDIIIFSDLDEIPDPDKVRVICDRIRENEDNAAEKVFHMAQRMFYCYLNMEETSGSLLAYCGEFPGIVHKKWLGTKICSWKVARTMPLGELRWPKCKDIGVRVDDGGWHFGYMGGSGEKSVRKRVAEKVKAAAHQEFNNSEVLSQAGDRIDDGRDIFGRKAEFRLVPIDDTYPAYIREHQEEYSYLIKKPDSRMGSVCRHIRMKARGAFCRAVRGAKHCAHRIIGR